MKSTWQPTEAHRALTERFHIILKVGQDSMAKGWPEGEGEGTKSALILMAAYALKRLAAIGYNTKDVMGFWEHVRSDPSTLQLMDEVAAAAQKLR